MEQQKQNSSEECKIESSSLVISEAKRETNWPSVLFYIHLHILGAYGLFLMLTSTSWMTIIFVFILTMMGILGATAGAHRLWAHKTYTATTSLRIFLMICQTLVGQGSIYDWVRAHRLHHEKFRQPEDPFFSKDDLLSAQVYAQVLSYTPQQIELLNKIDMSDIEKDKVVMFQKRFYWVLFIIMHVLIPVNTPLADFGESLVASLLVAFSLRYMVVLNICWLINAAHLVWGITKESRHSDSNSVFFITKSYYPQYHYILPNDYQSGEFGNYGCGFTTTMIRIFAALNLATDLQTITSTAVRNGLTEAVETDRPIIECIQKYVQDEREQLSNNIYIQREK